MIYLGNLGIAQMEKRTGIEFPSELKEFMEPRHQQKASKVKPNCWHCFDIPFVLVCGDTETATEIHSHLKGFASEFEKPLQIAIEENKCESAQ